jgi:hypothetical protein
MALKDKRHMRAENLRMSECITPILFHESHPSR